MNLEYYASKFFLSSNRAFLKDLDNGERVSFDKVKSRASYNRVHSDCWMHHFDLRFESGAAIE